MLKLIRKLVMNSHDMNELSSQISKIFELHSAGGPLHIVLADGNTGDDSIRYCLDTCHNHPAVTKNPKTAELLIHLVESVGDALLKMDEEKRNDLYDQRWGMRCEQNENKGFVARILSHIWGPPGK